MNIKETPNKLSGPNDDSTGHCYAPVENGMPNFKKKKHFDSGKEYPVGWKYVDCSPDCNLKF